VRASSPASQFFSSFRDLWISARAQAQRLVRLGYLKCLGSPLFLAWFAILSTLNSRSPGGFLFQHTSLSESVPVPNLTHSLPAGCLRPQTLLAVPAESRQRDWPSTRSADHLCLTLTTLVGVYNTLLPYTSADRGKFPTACTGLPVLLQGQCHYPAISVIPSIPPVFSHPTSRPSLHVYRNNLKKAQKNFKPPKPASKFLIRKPLKLTLNPKP
jgi:hypothetical protein